MKIIIYFIKKYLFSKKKEWKRYDSIFMILGIVISVATLITALTIFSGYEHLLKKTILGVNSHIYFFKRGQNNLNKNDIKTIDAFLKNQPEVKSSAKLITAEAMLSNSKRIEGCLIRGIDWNSDLMKENYKNYIFRGTHKLLKNNEIVLAYRLANKLQVDIDDKIQVLSPSNTKITTFGIKNYKKEFRVVGLYRSGMYEYDTKFIFMKQTAAAKFLLNPHEFSMVEVKLKDEFIESADYLAYIWAKQLDNYQINSWIDYNSNLFSLLKLEKWVIFIIFSFLIIVASFNVVSAISTAIIDSKREIGILKAVGLSNNALKKIYMIKTLFISIISIILGEILGIILSLVISKQNLFVLQGDVYFLDKINLNFSFFNFIVVFLVAILIVFFASLIPLKRISELNVTEIIR